MKCALINEATSLAPRYAVESPPEGSNGRFPSRLRPSVCCWWFGGTVCRPCLGAAERPNPGLLARHFRIRRSVLEIRARAVCDARGSRRPERRQLVPGVAARPRGIEARERQR